MDNYNIISICAHQMEACSISEISSLVSNHHLSLTKADRKWEKVENSGRLRAEAAEKKLKETLDNLEELVSERTAELEETFESLEKSENGLAKAQKIAHLGSWDWDIVANNIYWSNETYRIFGLKPQKLPQSYNTFINYVHTDDRKIVNNAIKRAVKGNPYDIEHELLLLMGKNE